MSLRILLVVFLGLTASLPSHAFCIARDAHAFQLSKAYKWLNINRDNILRMARALPAGKDQIGLDVRLLVDDVQVQFHPVAVLALLRRNLRSVRDIHALDDEFNYEAVRLRDELMRNADRLNELAVLETNPAITSQILSIRDRMQEVGGVLTNCSY